MSKLNVVVIFGGVSTEHDISKRSVNLIINNLSIDKYNIIPIYITKDGKWFMYEGPIRNAVDADIEKVGTRTILSPDRDQGLIRIVGDKFKIIPVDVAIPVLHGKNGEDGTIQGFLELAGIPYVGCGVLASAAAMDKEFTKMIVQHIVYDNKIVEQAKHFVFNKHMVDYIDDYIKLVKNEINSPVYVKPANSGSSYGVTKATNAKEIKTAILLALEHDKKVIIEEEIVGRELECAVLGNGNDVIASNIGEILTNGDFYDYNSKYESSETRTCILDNIDGSNEILEEIKTIAKNIFTKLECKGLSRVDFFYDEVNKKIIFNEINTFPGFTDISMYPVLMQNIGFSPKTVLDNLINIALHS
ncbi:MAG: D-alanine--D-alanine ligase family protein [Lachnospirales bacterium]